MALFNKHLINYRTVRIAVCGLLCLMVSLNSYSYQFPIEYPFQHINREDGLSQGTAYSINQDPTGFIWIGTQEGLNRFDGRRIQAFTRSTTNGGLADSYIYYQLNDPMNADRMWVGTHGGLHSFSHTSSQFKRHEGRAPHLLTAEKIYYLQFVEPNLLWLATDQGLSLYDVKREQNQVYYLTFSNTKASRLNTVYWFLQLDPKRMLLATAAGLFVFDKDTQKIVEEIAIPQSPTVWRVMRDSQQTIWVATAKGLYRLTERLTVEKEFLGDDELLITDKNIYEVFEDNQNNLWIGSGNGVFMRKSKQVGFTHLQNDKESASSITNNVVYSIFQDANSTIWFGTDSGVSRYSPLSADFNLMVKRADETSLSDNWVNTLLKAPDGRLWVSTNSGIDGFDVNGVKQWHYDLRNGMSSNWVYSLLLSDPNTLWAGSFDGLNKINVQSGEISHVFKSGEKDSISDNLVWQLQAEGKDSIWLGTNQGLNLYHIPSGKLKAFQNGDVRVSGLTNERVYSLHKSDASTLWVGTSKGLNKLDLSDYKITQFNANPKQAFQLSNQWVTGLSSDSAERVWIATDGGLNMYDPDTQKIHQFPQFKPTQEFIYAIQVDPQDRVWFSTNSGIGRIKYLHSVTDPFDAQQFDLVFYTKSDGLQGNEYNEFASQLTTDGNLYFGGVNGLNWFEPDKIDARLERPPVPVITQIEVNGKQVSHSELQVEGNQSESGASQLVGSHSEKLLSLTHQENHLTFYFAALDYVDPLSNRIEYRMNSINGAWHKTTGNQPFVSFLKLTPGDYLLEVRAATARSDWHPQIAKLKIIIAPPFWQSRGAYLFYLIIIILLTVTTRWRYKVRISRLRDLVAREQQVSARLKEVDAIKNQILANTSHELKTPLNAIIGLSDYLLSEQWSNIQPKEARESLELIRGSGHRMNELIEDILQSSSLTGGNIQLNKRKFNLSNLVEECISEIIHSTDQKSCKLVNRIAKRFNLVYGDPSRIKQVLINLVGNAVKFTPKGEVSVEAIELATFVEIKVSDNGIGIDEKFHQQIFEAFVQVDGSPSRKYEGSGLGLSIVKQLVNLHGGEVYIKSKPAMGTQITFTLAKVVVDN